MIRSAREFAQLRTSEVPTEYNRAANEEAPVEVWFAVIEQFPELREWVAHNKTVPLVVLERLATDSSSRVRTTVAGKRKLTRDLQSALAGDPDSSVRWQLANNAKCETDILRLLAADSETFVRAAAENRLQERSSAL